MFNFIGPYTTAVGFGVIFIVLSGVLATRGVWGRIVGSVTFAFAVGVVVGIAFPQHTNTPGLNLPIGYTATLAAALFVGVTMVTGAREPAGGGGGKSWRNHMPQFESQSVALMAVGLILVVVPLSVVMSNLDFNSDNTGAGLNIFTEGFEQQNNKFMREIERFLAK